SAGPGRRVPRGAAAAGGNRPAGPRLRARQTARVWFPSADPFLQNEPICLLVKRTCRDNVALRTRTWCGGIGFWTASRLPHGDAFVGGQPRQEARQERRPVGNKGGFPYHPRCR